MSEQRVVTVTLKLVVSDTSAKVVGGDADSDRVAELVREAVVWEDATAVEVREVSISVPLLARPVASDVPVDLGVVVDQDVRALVDAELARRRHSDRSVTWSVMIDALEPGLYRVTHGDGMRGMSRVQE